MAVNYKQFEAEFGFKSPNFSVDDEGNVTLRSITYLVPPEEEVDLTPDYNVTEQSGNFFITEESSQNPTLNLIRGTEYVFRLTLSTITFNVYSGAILYSNGLSHTEDGIDYVEEIAAQNKNSGFLIFNIPANAPDTLTVRDLTGNISFTINLTDPVFTGDGNFNNITATGNVNFIGNGKDIIIAPTGAGSLTISPPQGTLENMNIFAKTLSVSDTVTLSPVNKNVVITPTLSGKITIDSGTTGTINNVNIGEFTPANGNFLDLKSTSGSLNNTVIGDEIPTSANFTSIGLTQSPVNSTDVTNKQYVDNAVVAFAIAFGL